MRLDRPRREHEAPGQAKGQSDPAAFHSDQASTIAGVYRNVLVTSNEWAAQVFAQGATP